MHRDMSGTPEYTVLSQGEAPSRLPPVTLSYVYTHSGFKVRAQGGDVSERTKATENAYKALQGFSMKFADYMLPLNTSDNTPGDLLCRIEPMREPAPGVDIAFRLDPALQPVVRQGVVHDMNLYLSQALGVPLQHCRT